MRFGALRRVKTGRHGREPGASRESHLGRSRGRHWEKLEHVCRIIPVENCADSAEYEKLADEVVPLHFPKKEVPDPEKRKTFEVRFEQHCPAEGKHDEARSKKIVELFAARVPEETYKVNLSNPQSTVLVVECGKTFFCGVVDDYEGKMKKCNVREFKKGGKRTPPRSSSS